MNTPLEELITKTVKKAFDDGMNNAWKDVDNQILPEEYEIPIFTKKLISRRTEEIAIGFSKWCEENGWSWSIDHQLYLHYDGKSLGKTDSELFALYMESLKP